jgi:hypothetical protein
MPALLLIHGGLWEDIGADWFWRRPGIPAGFEAAPRPEFPPHLESFAASLAGFAGSPG